MPLSPKLPWIVLFTGRAKKQKEQLPPDIAAVLALLYREMTLEGPEWHNWANYGLRAYPDINFPKTVRAQLKWSMAR